VTVLGEIVDAHHHLWAPDRYSYPWLEHPKNAAIRRDVLPAELEAALAPTSVVQTVCVQAGITAAESSWLLSLVPAPNAIAGVVVQHSLDDPGLAKALAQMRSVAGSGAVVGLRDPALARGLVLPLEDASHENLELLGTLRLPVDVLAGPDDLAKVRVVALDHPGTVFVLDHLGGPPLSETRAEMTAWSRELVELAGCSNVRCKLSGLAHAGDYRLRGAIASAVAAALDAFGPTRLMYGSDWPISAPVAGYSAAIDALADVLPQLQEHEASAIWAGTARTTYQLQNGTTI